MIKIIFAIDDSEYSARVLETVAKRMWPDGSVFKLLTVLEPTDLSKNQSLESMENEIRQRRKTEAQRLLDEACKRLSTANYDTIQIEIREGNPKQEIVNAAKEWSADKILVGAHGHDVCPTFSLGNTSRTVAQHAPCTVEIIRAK